MSARWWRLLAAGLSAALSAGFAAAACEAEAPPVVAAAGDIACDPASPAFRGGAGSATACHARATSDLLLSLAPQAVLALGDNQYYCGDLSAFQRGYDRSWGRLKDLTRPVVGNHEYLTEGATGCGPANAGAAGYFAYFGEAAGVSGQGWYSFDIGAWHLVALNSSCAQAGGCGPDSPQGRWLAADLAAHPNRCTLAYWHIPMFSSGGRGSPVTRALWDQLYQAGADVVLSGHDHIYERFAPQTPQGLRDDRHGIRQFVVGTGGANHTPLATVAANSESRDDTTFGVLALTLRADGYDWLFVPETAAAGGFADSGSAACHDSPAG